MHLELTGYISLATLLAVLGLWGRLYLMNFQFSLMWRDYCERKGIPYNGKTTTAGD
jgi:hypothetical protein